MLRQLFNNFNKRKTSNSAGGNQGAEFAADISLNKNHTPPVTGALGLIGLCGRAGQFIHKMNFIFTINLSASGKWDL